jgi:hypothetical protein
MAVDGDELIATIREAFSHTHHHGDGFLLGSRGERTRSRPWILPGFH